MIINIGYINNLIGTTIAACLLQAASAIVGAWSSPVLPKVLNATNENPFGYAISTKEASWISSLPTVGAVVGCWVFAIISDKIGRKPAAIFLGIPIVIGCILMVSIPKVKLFYVGRFLQGLTIGGFCTVIISYLGEVTSKNNRNAIISIVAATSSLGSLFTYSVGPWVSVTFINILHMIFPILYLIVGMLFFEESPYFFLMMKKEKQARKTLEIYRGFSASHEEEIQEMKDQITQQQKGNIGQIIKTKGYLKAFIIANAMMIGQQVTGITGIQMYSQTIFNMTGSSLPPEVCTIILAVIQFTSGAIAPYISNKFGKREILFVSGAGMAISEILLGVYCILTTHGKDLSGLRFVPILTLTFFMLSYNFGYGPLCWVIAAEMYPSRVRNLSISISISIYFGSGFLIAYYFNTVANLIGIGNVFLGFAGGCLASMVFVKFCLFETSGRTLEDIQDILNGKRSANSL